MIPPFVTAGWLERHRDAVVVADVRWYLDGRSGRAAYEAGHIPGAVFVSLEDDLAAPAGDGSRGRHPLPAPDAFASAMGALGIGDADAVVAYDDDGGAIAARMAWMLRATGHEAAVLDGGVQAWPGALATGTETRPAAAFAPQAWPAEQLAGIDEVAVTSDVVIDARAAGRFAGEPDGIDPRPGHVPGAHSVPTREHVGPDGRLRPPDELRDRFAAAGIREGTAVVSYCGSGVTACHNLLVLEHAGLGPGRLFPGSWSQWSRDPARPVETGP